MFAEVFFTAMIVVLVWATVWAKEAWPLSHYPMFSDATQLEEVEVFRLALETRTGEIIWWQSHFYRYPEYIGSRLQMLARFEREQRQPASLALLVRRRYVLEVLRLIAFEEGSLQRYHAVHIVQRTASHDSTQRVVIHDTTMAKMLLVDIQPGPSEK